MHLSVPVQVTDKSETKIKPTPPWAFFGSLTRSRPKNSPTRIYMCRQTSWHSANAGKYANAEVPDWVDVTVWCTVIRFQGRHKLISTLRWLCVWRISPDFNYICYFVFVRSWPFAVAKGRLKQLVSLEHRCRKRNELGRFKYNTIL